MGGIAQTWMALSVTKRIVLAAVVAVTIGLTFYLAEVARKPSLALLYAGLDERAAGEVIVQLDQMGVTNEVRGAAIYVPKSERDRVRMALASAGLPSNGQQGYELLDGLSGFGTTADMFDAAYWRAKEGELARTLLAAPGIRQARVHIATPRRRSFARGVAAPTASVTLKSSGGSVPRASATAARYLVALAIPGLAADQVAVIDSDNGVILKPGDETDSAGGVPDSERAQKMKSEIEAILAARVGVGRARVSVNIETTRETKSVTRRTVDPESRALRESESVEMTEQGEDAGNNVTVASNLPDGDANAGGGRSSQREETRKTDRYDYTETREEVLRPAGTIRRIGVAILLDEIRETDAAGNVTSAPRPAEEMAKLEKLVKSAIGFDEDRGDVVTVESIPFAEAPEGGSLASTAELPTFVETNMMQLIQLGVLAFVILALGFFVVRPVLASGRQEQALLQNEDPALSAIDVTPPEVATAAAGATAASAAAQMASEGSDSSADAQVVPPDALELLRLTVADRVDDSVGVLKGWLDHEPEKAQ